MSGARAVHADLVCGVAALALCAALAAGCGRSGPQAVSAPAVPLPVRTLLGPHDEIDALDVAAGPDGALEVAWREARRDAAAGAAAVFTTRHATVTRDAGGDAAAPMVIEAARGQPARIVAGADGLHALAGAVLAHARHDDGTWRALPDLLPAAPAGAVPSAPRQALAFDVAALDGGLVVAFVAREPDAAAPATSAGAPGLAEQAPLGLFVVHWNAQTRGGPAQRVAVFPPTAFDPPAPRLLVEGRTLHLLAAVTGERREWQRSGAGLSEVVRTRAQLVYLQSSDAGATWSRPAAVMPDASEPDAGSAPPEIRSVELVRHGDELLALHASFGVYVSRSRDGRSWLPPRRLAGYETGLEGGTHAFSLSAIGVDGGVALAWIDERFQRSDRRWWKPLGGWPWSDSPDWSNNDVFLLRPPALAAALAGRSVVPERQTPPLARATAVRLQSVRGRPCLVWAGRTQVGHRSSSPSIPPSVFWVQNIQI